MNTNLFLGARPDRETVIHNLVPAHQIMSLLTLREDKGLADFCERYGYTVHSFPMQNGYRAQHSPVHEWIVGASILENMLQQGPVYLHCHSGIHRTGAMAYTYYREFYGMGHDEAFNTVVSHRSAIGQYIGEHLGFMVRYYNELDKSRKVGV